MAKTVIALFDNIGQAQDAIDSLRASGFGRERIQMHTGEEFVRRSELPPPAHEREGLWLDIRRFLDEIGILHPAPSPESTPHPIERDDGVVLVETSDERADLAAKMLDESGAVDIEARLRAGPIGHRASGLEAQTSGRIPPDLQETPPNADVDERALAGGTPSANRRARVYDRSKSREAEPGTSPRHSA